MENQHRKITGYRDLSQTEIDLMNTIKGESARVAVLLEAVSRHLDAQHKASITGPDDDTENVRLLNAEPRRWLAMARTDFQTGFMKLVRAVAQPTTF